MTWVESGEVGPISATTWPHSARLGPDLAQYGPNRPELAECGQNLGSQGNFSTTGGQLFGSFRANSELAGIVGSNCSGRAASNVSGTFGYFAPLCRYRHLEGRWHRNRAPLKMSEPFWAKAPLNISETTSIGVDDLAGCMLLGTSRRPTPRKAVGKNGPEGGVSVVIWSKSASQSSDLDESGCNKHNFLQAASRHQMKPSAPMLVQVRALSDRLRPKFGRPSLGTSGLGFQPPWSTLNSTSPERAPRVYPSVLPPSAAAARGARRPRGASSQLRWGCKPMARRTSTLR